MTLWTEIAEKYSDTSEEAAIRGRAKDRSRRGYGGLLS